MANGAYTGLTRKKQTAWSVKFTDSLASRLIAIGGIGTIAAILLVVIVLVGTAAPLLQSPEFSAWKTVEAEDYVQVGMDPEALLLWGLKPDGSIATQSTTTGKQLDSFDAAVPDDVEISTTSISIDRRKVILGLSNGTFTTAELSFADELFSPEDLPEDVRVSEESPVADGVDGSIYQWLDRTTVRQISLEPPQWSEPIELGSGPILAIDYLDNGGGSQLSMNSEVSALAIVDQKLVHATIESRKNMLTRKVTQTVDLASCEYPNRAKDGKPLAIGIMNNNTQGLVVWAGGTIDRFSLRGDAPVFAESQSASMGDAEITSAAPLLARQNMLCGLSDGRLQGWMVTRPDLDDQSEESSGEEDSSTDTYELTLAHEISATDQPITAVASSEQTHVAMAADAKGKCSLVYVTTDTVLQANSILDEAGDPVSDKIYQLSLSPSGNGIAAIGTSGVRVATFDIGHPEASLRTFFGKVWYEGHNKPKYIWQSTSGTEKSEIKLSLMPLVFGTLKATVYAMLISVPLAILAAVYTSEFLTPATRSRVKPAIEMMASLPSVVLGYIAALVFAPFLQANLLAILLGFVVVPTFYVIAGSVWNLLPIDRMVRFQRWRLAVMLLCIPFSCALSVLIAAPIESLLFDGDIISWLSSDQGSAVGGWMIILTPILILVATCIFIGPLAERNRRTAAAATPQAYAIANLGRLFAGIICVVVSALAIGFVLDAIGWDLRNSFFDSYQDRNALLVGIALGFCVIPIIYTLSDDALQAVPRQLRSASLGCGATPWQTTTRVVIPSAMSGIFGAIMIGLGRAVGETMVVLMAAGNTPVMVWNPFNGFRTLSATLATELAEAAKGSTHFRTLFLAALLLFVLTLLVNTIAEFVRIRFRKRASQL